MSDNWLSEARGKPVETPQVTAHHAHLGREVTVTIRRLGVMDFITAFAGLLPALRSSQVQDKLTKSDVVRQKLAEQSGQAFDELNPENLKAFYAMCMTACEHGIIDPPGWTTDDLNAAGLTFVGTVGTAILNASQSGLAEVPDEFYQSKSGPGESSEPAAPGSNSVPDAPE